MKKKSLISILISNYNKEKFLKNCLRSVCSQAFKNYEIILFDDCSTDNSLKIIKKFKKVKLIKNKKKKSISAPLNQIYGLIEAFKKSKGEIICLLDSDDMFMKDKLRIVNDYFSDKKDNSFLINYPESKKQLRLSRVKGTLKIWPSIFPTSCISFRKKVFKKFLKYVLKNKFPNLEIDARISIFSYYYLNDYNFIDKKLTNYITDELGITSRYNYLSANWWFKRREAFLYLDFIIKNSNKSFIKSFDYYITFLMCEMLEILKTN